MRASDRTRLNFTDSGLLTAEDFAREQAYHLDTQALRCRSLHSWGVAFGLEVSVRPGGLSITISPGLAINALGQQIRLPEATDLDLSDQISPAVFISIGETSTWEDWKIYPLGAGYVRIADRANLILTPEAPLPDGRTVPLAKLTFTPARRIDTPDLTSRRLCGLTVGDLILTPPAGAASPPTLAMNTTGTALVVASALTDLFGSLAVAGTVAIGPEPAADTALQVQAGAAVAGAGVISSDHDVIFGADAYDLASLTPGDQIQAPISATVSMDTAFQALTVVSVASQTVTVSPPPSFSLSRSPYAIARGAVARIRTDALTTGLSVSSDGPVGVGGDPGAARLAIRGGDMLLAGQPLLQFSQDGSVQTTGDPADQVHAIHFWASKNLLEVRESGQILFETSGDPEAVPALTLASNQNVGVGVATPGNRLTVDGVISASEGVIFADSSQQTQGLVAIPVGSIVSWWNSALQLPWTSDGFQLCDGSTITDPASPLVGTRTPDLRQAFVRGVASYEQIGQTGGAASHTHVATLAQHTHPIVHTHDVLVNTTSITGTNGLYAAGSDISQKFHIHSFTTTSSTADQAATGDNVAGDTAVTTPAADMPPYVALLRAMRIK